MKGVGRHGCSVGEGEVLMLQAGCRGCSCSVGGVEALGLHAGCRILVLCREQRHWCSVKGENGSAALKGVKGTGTMWREGSLY